MNHPHVGGTITTIGAAFVSFAASSLPIVQWVAAAIAIVVGVRTLWRSFK